MGISGAIKQRLVVTVAGVSVSALAITAFAQAIDESATSSVATTTGQEQIAAEPVLGIVNSTTTTEDRTQQEQSSSETVVQELTESSQDTLAPVTEPTLPSALKIPTAINDIASLEDAFFENNGAYLQILPGNQLPEYETGTVAEKLGSNIPDNAYVHVYESPRGKGYQIFYDENGIFYSSGYGPEATERTYARQIQSSGATSTEVSL